MQAINTPDGQAAQSFIDGQPFLNIEGTQMTALWCNQVQTELLTILAAAGIVPSAEQSNQILTALQELFAPANFMTIAAAVFAPLISPALTGRPTVPTQAPGDSSTAAASTAFVQTALNELGGYLLDTGAANAYVVAFSPAVTAYTNGLSCRFRAVHANTLASTLNAGAGAAPLRRDDGSAVQLGDILANDILSVTYDLSANVWLINSVVPSQMPTVTDILYLGQI